MNWHFSTVMLCEIFAFTVLFQATLGFQSFDEEQYHTILPISQGENSGLMSLLEEQPLNNGMSAYLREGRRLFRLPQTLIPYPRTGRMTDEDYEFAFVPDYPWSSSLESELFETSPRTPQRLGRRKRSVTDDGSEHKERENEFNRKELEKAILEGLDDFEPNYYMRKIRRPNSRSRNSFVPRVGKRIIGEELDDMENKRAVAFTPRIGRASLIPRIGRNDPRFKVKSRGAFIPRIGRRASFTPRIGRSQETRDETESN